MSQPGGNLSQIPGFSLVVADIGVSTQHLHNPLQGAGTENTVIYGVSGDIFPLPEQFIRLFRFQTGVAVIDQGGQIIFRTAAAHALKINQPGFSRVDMHVLGLAVPVDGAFRKGRQKLRLLFQGGMVQEGSRFQPQVGSQEMFSKIGLLPAVQGLVKSGLEGKFLRKRAGVKQMELFHSPDVAQAQGRPGFFPESQQVGVSQVFHQGGSASGTERFIIVNFRHVDTVGVQMPGCGDKRIIVRTVISPLDADACAAAKMDADDRTARGSQNQGAEIFLTRNNVKTPVNQTGQFFHGKVAWLR